MYHPELIRHPESCPALVLNADYTPLSYYPLSLWPWQTAIKAMFLERVDVVAHYDREVHSPSVALKLPSVIALRDYVRPNEDPAFTRFNLFLRDKFSCVYCGTKRELTFDHVIPRAYGGRTTWRTSPPPAPPATCARAGALRQKRTCTRTASRFAPPRGSCRSMDAHSRPITCTKAGATISTGMSSWSRDVPRRRPGPRAGTGRLR